MIMNRIHPKLVRVFSLLLAGALQIMPIIRSALPTFSQSLAPSTGSIIFRWAAGGLAYFGYHAISSASSIAISPPNATIGVPYVGTVTYSGGHAGSVSSMSLTNTCLGSSTPLFAGLNVVYTGGNTASVTGTPSATNTFRFALRIYDSSSCGSGNTDTRSTSLVVGPNGGAGVAPAITGPPQSLTAQEGADVLFSVGASGTPAPNFYWFRGPPSGGVLISASNTLHFPSVQLANAGSYSVVASNASTPNILLAPFANCYLSVCQTAGDNPLAYQYTNYYPAGVALVLSSSLTNVPGATNNYTWLYNGAPTVPPLPHTPTVTVPAAAIKPSGSGTYSISFVSALTSSGEVLVDGTTSGLYPSYWAFGLAPTILVPPKDTNVNAGVDVTLSATATNNSTAYGPSTPLAFYWFLNGTNLVASHSATGLVATASLALNSVGPDSAGSYTLVASNYWGSTTSSPALLALASSAAAPTISSEPVGRSVLTGQNASFSVTAAGSAPLSYQWLKENVSLSNDGTHSGVFTNVLILTGVGTNDAGDYSVVITNAVGSTNSATVHLAVVAPPGLVLGGNGSGVQLSASTITGIVYVVQTTTNLSSPWVPVATNTVPGTGLLMFTNPTTSPVQFYRTLFP